MNIVIISASIEFCSPFFFNLLSYFHFIFTPNCESRQRTLLCYYTGSKTKAEKNLPTLTISTTVPIDSEQPLFSVKYVESWVLGIQM